MTKAFKKIEAGLKDAISLRKLWDDAAREPVPESFKELLAKLK